MSLTNSPNKLPPSPAPVFIRPACHSIFDGTGTSPPQFVQFRHPGYPDSHDLMLRLSALDRASTPSEVYQSGATLSPGGAPPNMGIHHAAAPPKMGIHYATALQACIIIACNEPGFLSPTKLRILPAVSTPATQLALNSVLTEKSYWFYPFNWKLTDDPYPVCPDFENWSFPTEDIPDDWIAMTSEYHGVIPAPSQFSRIVNERDPACRISDFVEMTQVAHLVPREERSWFMRNLMYQFNLNATLSEQYLTCDVSNCIRLRQDLHALFDAKSFVLAPKNGVPVVHFLVKGVDYCKMYHGRATAALNVNPAFLYARFGWAVLPLIINFARRRDVRIKVYNEETAEWEITTAGAVLLKEAAAKTPTKRRRRAHDMEADDSEQGPPGDIAGTKRMRLTTESPMPIQALTNSFNNIVAANPKFAWDGLGWHPDLERIQALRQKELALREPVLHEIEVKRQLQLLERQGSLWEADNQSDSD